MDSTKNTEINLGGIIKAARKKKKINQTQFAECLHKSFSVIQKYEQNKIIPPYATLIQIIEYLDIPACEVSSILYSEAEKKKPQADTQVTYRLLEEINDKLADIQHILSKVRL